GTSGVRRVLWRAVLADHLDIGRTDGVGGRGRGTEPRRGAPGPRRPGGPHRGAVRRDGRLVRRPVLSILPTDATRGLRHARSGGRGYRDPAAARPERVGVDRKG